MSAPVRQLEALSISEQRELARKVDVVYDFVMTLQALGLEMAQSTSPAAVMIRNMIPGFGG